MRCTGHHCHLHSDSNSVSIIRHLPLSSISTRSLLPPSDSLAASHCACTAAQHPQSQQQLSRFKDPKRPVMSQSLPRGAPLHPQCTCAPVHCTSHHHHSRLHPNPNAASTMISHSSSPSSVYGRAIPQLCGFFSLLEDCTSAPALHRCSALSPSFPTPISIDHHLTSIVHLLSTFYCIARLFPSFPLQGWCSAPAPMRTVLLRVGCWCSLLGHHGVRQPHVIMPTDTSALYACCESLAVFTARRASYKSSPFSRLVKPRHVPRGSQSAVPIERPAYAPPSPR